MKKIYFFIIGIISIILIISGLFLFYNNISDEKFNKKINLLNEEIVENQELKNLKKKQNEHIAIISICDNKTQAVVKKAKANSMNKAYRNVKKQVINYIDENNYSADLVKVDFAKEIEEISSEELKRILSNLKKEYTFRFGLVLEYQEQEDIILTEAELNSNNIIDYDNCEINIENLNKYLKILGKENVNGIPKSLKKFNTISYFCDTNNDVFEIDNATGKRKISELSKDIVNEMLNNSTNYLVNMVEDNGKFIYGYSPLKNEERTSYNILRHAGTIWSMVKQYDSNTEQKQAIINSINYLISTVKNLDDNTAYIEELKNNELKLGGNALAIIALSEYTDKFEDSSYQELLEKLGNGILSLQQEDGSYIHVLNSEDFSIKDEYRTVYYDGEATFALCKLYSITNDKKYLEAAQKSIQYFIDNNYTKYCDHWISYAVNEITNYVDKEEYYEFGLKNIFNNLETIKNKEHTSHINFEMLIQGFELYDKIIEKKLNIKYLEEISIKDLIDVIEYRAQFQLNSYLYPEIAIYLKYPEKYSDTFYIRHNDFRIRIDDIQHSILGYHFYNANFDKINKIKNSL